MAAPGLGLLNSCFSDLRSRTFYQARMLNFGSTAFVGSASLVAD